MLKNKVALGAIWLFSGKFLSHIIALGGMAIVARLLSPEDVGLIAFAMAMMTLISAVADMPVSAALIQLKDPKKEDFDTAFTLSLMRGLLVAALIASAAWPISHYIGQDERLLPIMLFFASYPLIASLRNPNFEVKAKEMKFNFEFNMMIAAKVASFIATVWIAYATRSYWAMAIGQIVMVLVQTLMTYILVPKLPGLSLKSWKKIFSFSGWMGVSWFVNQLNWRSDVMFVQRAFGPAVMGFYHLGNQLTNESTQMMMQAIQKSLFSAFSHIQDDLERMRRGFLNAQGVTFALISPIAFGLAMTADWVVPLVYGQKWMPAVIVVQIAAPFVAFNTWAAPSRAVGMSLGRTRELFIRDCIALVIRVPMMIVGLMFWGLAGLLLARGFAGVVMVIINMAMVKRFIDLKMTTAFLNIRRPLLNSLIMVGCVLGLKNLIGFEGDFLNKLISLMIVVGGGAAVYTLTSLLTWRIAGKPEGLENRIGRGLVKVRNKLRKGGAPAAA